MELRFLFRADADRRIGLGHLSRTLTLAEELQSRGNRCVVVYRDDADSIARSRVEQSGVEARPLHVDLAEEASDATATCEEIERSGIHLAVVDSYALGRNWWQRVARRVPLCLVDDLGRQDATLHADCILNQNPGARSDWYRASSRLWLGTRYSLLGRELAAVRRPEPRTRSAVNRLLVSVGGADPQNLTGRILAALKGIDSIGRIDVVIGPGFHLDPTATSDDLRVKAIYRPTSLAPHLSEVDAVVCAGGTTVLEAASLGLAIAMVPFAENQKVVVDAMHEIGAAVLLGWAGELSDQALSDGLAAFLRRPDLEALGRAAIREVDGLGASRVALELEGLAQTYAGLSLSPATHDDSDILLEWRNRPDTYRYFLTPSGVDREVHEQWFSRALRDPDCMLWIARSGDERVGMIRFNCGGGIPEVSITVAGGTRGQGLGAAMLRRALSLFSIQRGRGPVLAVIHKENLASIRIFERIGFVRTGMNADFCHYVLETEPE